MWTCGSECAVCVLVHARATNDELKSHRCSTAEPNALCKTCGDWMYEYVCVCVSVRSLKLTSKPFFSNVVGVVFIVVVVDFVFHLFSFHCFRAKVHSEHACDPSLYRLLHIPHSFPWLFCFVSFFVWRLFQKMRSKRIDTRHMKRIWNGNWVVRAHYCRHRRFRTMMMMMMICGSHFLVGLRVYVWVCVTPFNCAWRECGKMRRTRYIDEKYMEITQFTIIMGNSVVFGMLCVTLLKYLTASSATLEWFSLAVLIDARGWGLQQSWAPFMR